MFYHCTSIFTVDISEDNITPILPTSNALLTTNDVEFKWKEVDFADTYNLQIVSPNFNSPNIYVIDSTITVSDIHISLNPGRYQWRVKAINNISETQYSSPISFEVDENIDLSHQSVSLQVPLDSIYRKDIQINFSWQNLSFADYYIFQIVKGNIFSNDILFQNDVYSNSFNPPIQLTDESEYTWKVKGVNSVSESQFSTRTLFIDRTLPNVPILTSPDDNANLSPYVTFTFNIGVDPGNVHAPIHYYLEISMSNNFSTLYDSMTNNLDHIEYHFQSVGTYYWRVKSIDEAGNESDFSNIRTVNIQ